MFGLLMFITGLCFGSFVSMASHRLPRNLEWVKTRSHCPQCKHDLNAKDLIPVFSWLWMRGKCRYCFVRINSRYPAIEIVTALHFLAMYMLFGLSPLMPVMAIFGTILLLMLVADLETGLIPDEIHFALLPLGILYHFLMGSNWQDVLITAALAISLGVFLHYGYFAIRGKHGLGLGDVKFLAVAGIWLGNLHPLVVFIFYSGLMGVLMGALWRFCTKEERFPFAPALAASLYLLVIFPEAGEWFWATLRTLLV